VVSPGKTGGRSRAPHREGRAPRVRHALRPPRRGRYDRPATRAHPTASAARRRELGTRLDARGAASMIGPRHSRAPHRELGTRLARAPRTPGSGDTRAHPTASWRARRRGSGTRLDARGAGGGSGGRCARTPQRERVRPHGMNLANAAI